MLGWHISVYRQKDGGNLPATDQSAAGTRLAVWQAGYRGLFWVNELVKADKAIVLAANGYPNVYTMTAEYVIPNILSAPPDAHEVWHLDEGDTVIDGLWTGKTMIDRDSARQCRFDEWLLMIAWDES